MVNFAIIGSGGYIAPRHLGAIKALRGNLIAATDIVDSYMKVSDYFEDAKCFTDFNDFEDYLLNKHKKNHIDYVSICSPNYLHFEHISWALKNGFDVICEKPLVLESKQLDELKELESISEARVFSILQLRYHKAIHALKQKFKNLELNKKIEVDLTYITPRDSSYLKTWKGSEKKSGGVVTNIGIHFFDMLYYVFGELTDSEVYYRDDLTVSGFLSYEFANVKWFLSIDPSTLPHSEEKSDNPSYRNILINNEILDFSGGFEDLHKISYENILSGNGFGLSVNAPAIRIVENIRNIPIISKPKLQNIHPYMINAKP